MFQYALGLSLSLKKQTKLLLDISQIKKNNTTSKYTFRPFELKIFNLNAVETSTNNLKILKPFILRVMNVISILIGFKGIQTSRYFIERNPFYNESIKIIGKQCYLSGYWQSYKYFRDYETRIRSDFKFPQILDELNETRRKQINDSNSISLHIRRADYINNEHHSIHGVCSVEYYNKSIEYIAERVKNPTLFVFSDDIEWARQNLDIAFPLVFVTDNTGEKSYMDMQLMSLCKHNIIANSSFSWWGAWLNSYKHKIIIAPKKWYADESRNSQTQDLIPVEWVRL